MRSRRRRRFCFRGGVGGIDEEWVEPKALEITDQPDRISYHRHANHRPNGKPDGNPDHRLANLHPDGAPDSRRHSAAGAVPFRLWSGDHPRALLWAGPSRRKLLCARKGRHLPGIDPALLRLHQAKRLRGLRDRNHINTCRNPTR